MTFTSQNAAANGSSNDIPIPASPLVSRSQQQQQRRRYAAATTPVITPRPESSPGISKLWMSASPRNIATPRRVLSYHSSSSSTSSPTASPRQQQKRRRRRILLTSLVGISTWMYISVAYFAVSQWYFLEARNGPSSQTLQEPASFSFPAPTKRGSKIRNRARHSGRTTVESNKTKTSTLTSTLRQEDSVGASGMRQPRIVHFKYNALALPKQPDVPQLLFHSGVRRSRTVANLPPLEKDNHNATEDGMGFQEILRGSNATLSDDEEGAQEEKSFVVPNATAINKNNEQDSPEDMCVPMQDWQSRLLCTCNSFHELDWFQPTFLAQGWFRDTWKYNDELVLKTLRWEREYLDEYYELHRRDAIAMEHLTFSPFVLNIMGHCGQSALNEFAAGVGDIQSLETLDRRLRGKESQSWGLKLRLATSVAVGLVHVHYGPPSSSAGFVGKNITLEELLSDTSTPASMAHYDINPRNIAIMPGGRPKINDFNVAEFLTVPDNKVAGNNNNCGKFNSRLHDPWWRAPEEMNMDGTSYVAQQADVYALGNVLFHILTTHSPRGKMKKERAMEVRELVAKGKRPSLPPPFDDPSKNKKNPIVVAFEKAMDLCFEADPTKRGTAKQVATVLHDAYQTMLAKQQKESKK